MISRTPHPQAVDSPDPKEYRRRIWNASIVRGGVFLGFAHGTTVLASMLTVPMAIRSLGSSTFGFWAALSSVIVVSGTLDFGLGSGIVTLVGRATGEENAEHISSLVSTAFLGLSLVGGVLAFAVTASAFLVDWRALLGGDDVAQAEAFRSVALVGIAIGITMPLGLAPKVRLALHRGSENGLWIAIGSIVQVLGVLLASLLGGGLVAFVIVFAFSPVIGLVGNFASLFALRGDQRWPGLAAVRLSSLSQLSRAGIQFFVIGIAGAVAFQSDTLVVARVLGASSAAEYWLTSRLFFFIVVLVGLFLVQMWPAYAEAAARADWQWVRLAFRRTLRWTLLLTSAVSLLLTVVGKNLISLLTDGEIVPDAALMAALGGLAVLLAAGSCIAMLLNGLHHLRVQVICSSMMAVLNLALSIVLAQRLGIVGVVLATLVTQGAMVVGPYALHTRRVLNDGYARGRT